MAISVPSGKGSELPGLAAGAEPCQRAGGQTVTESSGAWGREGKGSRRGCCGAADPTVILYP